MNKCILYTLLMYKNITMKINTLKIKELLRKKNISQAELARRINIKPQNLSNFISKGEIPLKHRDKILKILGEEFIELIEGSETYYVFSDPINVNENSGEYGEVINNVMQKEIHLLKARIAALEDLVRSKQKIIDLLENQLK